MLSPSSLLNVFFAAVLINGLQGYSSESYVLKDLVHPKKEPTTPGTETELPNVRRAV